MSTAEQLQKFLLEYDQNELGSLTEKAEKGDATAQFRLGALYLNGHTVEIDLAKGAKWLNKAARQGETAAQTLLAWMYAKGEGVGQSHTTALEWYLKAAEGGDSDAQCALGDIYQDGMPGIEANPSAMLEWYERAANDNHPKAQYMLGKLLAEGTKVEENSEAAFQWLTLAILNESEAAQKELAMLTARLGSETIRRFRENMMANFANKH
jgi:TPR repeat protein